MPNLREVLAIEELGRAIKTIGSRAASARWENPEVAKLGREAVAALEAAFNALKKAHKVASMPSSKSKKETDA